MIKHPASLLALICVLAVSAFGAPTKPADVKLGPALVALGAKYAPTYNSKEPVLSFKTDAPLSEEVFKEIENLAPARLGPGGKGVDNAALARFARLPLEAFISDGASFDDTGAAAFAQMRKLRFIAISHNPGIKTLAALAKHPALETLNCGGTYLDDTALPTLATIKTLRVLSLHHCSKITDAGLLALTQHPALESLTLNPNFNPVITDAALASLATLPKLSELSLGETVLTYEGLAKLKSAPALSKLTLLKIGVAPADVEKLKADLPKVDIKFTPAEPASVAKWQAARAKKKT